jgi:tetratricopeptide (TPR) repeat protein
VAINANLLKALTDIVSKYGGLATLSNARKVKALLADLAAAEPKPHKNALIACVEQGFPAMLQNVPAGGRGAAKAKLAERLNREEGLDPALCANTLDLLEAALFGGVSTKAAPPNTYYLSINYQQTGPFTLEQVKSMISGGRVSKKHWIRSGEKAAWMPVTKLPEINVLFANTGAAPKPVAPQPKTPPQSPLHTGDDASDKAKACLDRGDKYSEQGDYDRAIREYTKAIRIDPSDTDVAVVAYIARAVSYYKKEDYNRAIADFTELIRRDPSHAAVLYCSRGRAYQEKKNYNSAIADFNKAIQLDPSNAAAYCSRGRVYEQKKDYNSAIADFNKAIQLDPHDAWTYFHRGVSYLMMHDLARARADWKETLRIDPNHAEARDFLKDEDDDDDFKDDEVVAFVDFDDDDDVFKDDEVVAFVDFDDDDDVFKDDEVVAFVDFDDDDEDDDDEDDDDEDDDDDDEDDDEFD